MSPSPERPRSRWRLLRRVLLGVLVLVVLALIALSIWYHSHGQQWLDRTVRERIDEVVDRASVEGYTFTLGDLETDARNGVLAIWSTHPDAPFSRRLAEVGFRIDEQKVFAHRDKGTKHHLWFAQRGK